MRWLRPLLVIFLCPLLLLGASPEDFTAKLSASPNPLTLDDQAIVQLDLTFPSSYTVAIDTLQQRLSAQMLIETPAFQLVDQKSQQEEKEGVTSQQFTWVLDPQIIGQTQLGLVSIPFVSSTGEMIKIPVAPLTIQVSKSRWLDKGETIETAPLMPLSLNLPIPLLIQEKPKTVEEITAENRALLAQHRIPWLELL